MRHGEIRPHEMPPSEERHEEEQHVLDVFDKAYFERLEGKDGWIAIGQENCRNQRYFTVKDGLGERLGVVGMYDTDDDRNITHTVVDPAFRGKGLAQEFKELLLDATGEDHYVATVDLDNEASLRSMEKTPGIAVVSDQAYETRYHKRKFRYERPSKDHE